MKWTNLYSLFLETQRLYNENPQIESYRLLYQVTKKLLDTQSQLYEKQTSRCLNCAHRQKLSHQTFIDHKNQDVDS